MIDCCIIDCCIGDDGARKGTQLWSFIGASNNTIIRTTVDKKNGGLALLAYTLPTYRNNSAISTRETKYLITISE